MLLLPNEFEKIKEVKLKIYKEYNYGSNKLDNSHGFN